METDVLTAAGQLGPATAQSRTGCDCWRLLQASVLDRRHARAEPAQTCRTSRRPWPRAHRRHLAKEVQVLVVVVVVVLVVVVRWRRRGLRRRRRYRGRRRRGRGRHRRRGGRWRGVRGRGRGSLMSGRRRRGRRVRRRKAVRRRAADVHAFTRARKAARVRPNVRSTNLLRHACWQAARSQALVAVAAGALSRQTRPLPVAARHISTQDADAGALTSDSELLVSCRCAAKHASPAASPPTVQSLLVTRGVREDTAASTGKE